MAGNVVMFPSNFDLNMDDNDDSMPEHPGSETEIKLSCRHIRIGSYSYRPRSKVRISSEGVTILAPSLRRRAADDVILHIPLKSVVHVLARAEDRPAVVLYTEAKTGEYVRGALDMHRDSGPYFDPSSPSEEHKRILLAPRALPRRAAAALRSLFGMVLDELDGPLPNSPDHYSAPSESGPLSPLPADRGASDTHTHTRADSPVIAKDESSSSSVIGPHSPTPISVSSPSSSLHTPKSSHSSKKRKNRHKKNKSNKRMKYVLVKNPEPHAVDAFLAGVAPILKSLSPMFLNLAKSEIISAALKYERKMLTENCNGVE